MTNERLVQVARPLVQALRPAEDFRRARRVDRALDNQGNLVDVPAFTSAWNGNNPLKLGTWVFWIDGSGNLRKKNGSPTSDTDGTIV